MVWLEIMILKLGILVKDMPTLMKQKLMGSHLFIKQNRLWHEHQKLGLINQRKIGDIFV